jgi:subtilisin family serine protease
VSSSRRAKLKRPLTITLATAAITAFAMATAGYAEAGPAAAPKAAGTTAPYLVLFDGASIASYTGGVGTIAATKPVGGARLDRTSWNYKAYRQYLTERRADVLRRAKIDKSRTVAEFDTVLNGAAVKLTPTEVGKLIRVAGVRGVYKNQVYKVHTTSTPKFLGLDGSNGAWTRQFGDVSHAGEGVIVGVLDSGITPESASFAPLPEPRPDADAIADKWHGTCVAGVEAPVTCNNKLIGARAYNFGSIPIIEQEFQSPRDFDGHGTHTASTAAGNHGVPASVNGENVGSVSGMAPAARVAAYKVCWETEDLSTASCGGLETIAAINDAIDDGVDVLNFSVGGATASVADPVNRAFLDAAVAGIFVATSAGNTPGPSTVEHNVPWVTTVAASTHDRTFGKSVTLGNGTTFSGPGILGALPAKPLVDSVSVPAAGSTAEASEFCPIGSLDPAKVTGRIVLCARGGNVARTDKSHAVQQAGGVGMIMYNKTPNSLNADFHPIPSIHLGPTEGAAVKAYIAGTATPTASMTAAVPKVARAPQVASFSSSGPALAANGDLLKPDIAAPGVDVIAAVAPGHHFGNNFDAESGTSMASPHIAGIAALLRGRHPDWSPMAIKSAMMTTAAQTDNSGAPIQREGGAAGTPFDFGAGNVKPAGAFDPGLVYDSSPVEWVQFACGAGENVFVGETDLCPLAGSIDPSDLNYASIAVGDLAGKQTVTRTVTNTSNRVGVYFAKMQAPAGFTVKVTPSVLTVLPRRTATFTVEITRTTAPLGAAAFGALTWADLHGHSVRSPIAVRPVGVAAPVETIGTGASGSSPLALRTGYTGTLAAKPFGLVASAVTTKHLVGVDQNFNPTKPAESAAVGKATVTVPAGSKAARFATFDSDYPAGTDLDLFVYKDGTLVGVSAGTTAEERVTLAAPGTYDVFVVQFATVGTNEQDVRVHAFVVPPAAAGNLTTTPASQPAGTGASVSVTAAWSGLAPGRHYLGVIEYGDGTAAFGATIVSVNA